MPPDQPSPSSGGPALRAAFDRYRTVMNAELDRLFAIALSVLPATTDADALLQIMRDDLGAVRSETGSNTRTESVQQVGRP